MSYSCQLPGSYIRNELAKNRRIYFANNKKPLYSKWIKREAGYSSKSETDMISLDAKVFVELLDILSASGADWIRIYFATDLEDSLVRNRKKHRLTVIFAPAKQRGDGFYDTEQYYFVNGKLDTSSPGRLEGTTAYKMVNRYEEWKLKNVKVETSLEDTKSICFPIADITSWATFIRCTWDGQAPEVYTVRICFGAYDVDSFDDAKRNIKKGQLTFFFEFFDLGFTKLNIEEISWVKKQLEMVNGNYDTGNPCPPGHCKGAKLSK